MKIDINYNLKGEKSLKIYFLGIKVIRISLNKKMDKNGEYKRKNKLDKKDIISIINILKNTMKIEELYLDFGVNLEDDIINAFIIVVINMIILYLVNLNNKAVDLRKIRYNTFISSEIIVIDLKCIIKIPLVKNIPSIVKILSNNLKGGIKNGK